MLTHRTVKFLSSAALALAFSVGAAAQQTPATVASGAPETQHKSVVLDGEQKLDLDFTITALGSVTIQILQKAPNGGSPNGVVGFKVRLRSKDTGFERWYLDQFTDAAGTYTFECLRPGNYSIELDPANLKSAGAVKLR